MICVNVALFLWSLLCYAGGRCVTATFIFMLSNRCPLRLHFIEPNRWKFPSTISGLYVHHLLCWLLALRIPRFRRDVTLSRPESSFLDNVDTATSHFLLHQIREKCSIAFEPFQQIRDLHTEFFFSLVWVVSDTQTSFFCNVFCLQID